MRCRIFVFCSLFQSTLPVRGATWRAGTLWPSARRFQSTLPVRGATIEGVKVRNSWGISIHAPRAGSDVQEIPYYSVDNISIHAPRAGSDRTAAR